MSGTAFVMTWCDASGERCELPLAVRSLGAAWDAAFCIAEAWGWPACCSFAVGRSGAKAGA